MQQNRRKLEVTTELFKDELAKYEEEKEALLGQEGRFVLIKGREIPGIWDTYEDALQAGFEKFKLEPFLVKQIQGIERVRFFSRELCRP